MVFLPQSLHGALQKGLPNHRSINSGQVCRYAPLVRLLKQSTNIRAAAVWQRLDVEEKSEWSELAAKNQESHKLAFPGWKWQPNKRKRKDENPSVREIHYPPREDEAAPPAAHGPSEIASISPPSRLPSQTPAATPPAPAVSSEHWEDEIASASRKLKMIPEPPWASASTTSTSVGNGETRVHRG